MNAKMLLVLGFVLVGPSALAETVEGLVRGVGSGVNRRIVIAATGTEGPTLCSGDDTKKIARLSSLTVKVTGEWRLTKDGKQDCFVPASYTVTKTSNGRPAVVGVLAKEGSGYVVTADDGSTHPLTEVPDGLKGMVGKRVILDLKPMDNPALKEAASKVVTYSEMP